MRKIIVLSFVTLDGVIQSPGAPEEDTSGGFEYGGWVAPYDDESAGDVMQKLLQPADLLLGRKTFDIWEHYWPKHASFWPGINEVTKYVFSHTRNTSEWQNCVFIKSIDDIRNLKTSNGSDIKVWGSSKLIQLLLKHDLVDEFWLMIHPLVLGKGKKLFSEEIPAAAFTLEENVITSKGVIISHYTKSGKVITGRVGPE